MWMNQAEIEWAYSQRDRYDCPNVRKAVGLLYRLMQAVNDQSDGWPYWKAPSQAADKLMTLLYAAKVSYTTRGLISDADLKKAITPIRRMVTVQKKKQAKYGNTFEFDVDAALREEATV